MGNNSYKKVNTFKYLGTLLTNKYSVLEEIKCRLKAGNSFCYSGPFCLLYFSKNLKIKVYQTITL